MLRPKHPGFTLLEALVALVIFGILTAALSIALTSSLRAEEVLQQKSDLAAKSRLVFRYLEKDIQAGFISSNSPVSLFVGGVGAVIGGQAPAGALTLSALSGNIQTSDPQLDPTLIASAQAPTSATSSNLPQWNCIIVQYVLNSQTGSLYRVTDNAPNLQLIESDNSPSPDTLLTNDVASLTLSFYDPTQQQWVNSWDYEQQAQAAQNQSGSSGQPSGSSASQQQSSSAASSASSNQSGNSSFPSAVKIQLVLKDSSGNDHVYTTSILVTTPALIDPNTPAAQQSSEAASGSGANGSAASGTAASGGATGE